MPTIRANGLEVAYERVGAGPPLIMLHAASSSGRADFGAQIPRLAKEFTVLLPDARGHGGTRWDSRAGLRAEWLADDLLAFADALELETFDLLGFSMGAMTAIHAAVRRPERLRSLVLAAISVEREPRTGVARRLLDPDRIERDDPAWAARLARLHDPVQGAGAWRRLLSAIAADAVNQPLLSSRELHAVTCPTLVTSGDRDPFVPVDQAWRLSRQFVHGRLLVAPACGHQVLSERPAILNEALAGFYRSTRADASARAADKPEVTR